jgi:hypothetical protein
MYSLNATTKRNIETCVLLPFSELIALDHDDELRTLKPVNGGKIVFSTENDPRRIGRGNPFLARRRFREMEEVDKRLAEICNADAR